MPIPNELERKVPRTDLYDSYDLIHYHMPVEQPPATASYIIFKKGNRTYAKNGTYGHIEFEDTDSSSVIQNAANNGGLIYIKQGTYSIGNLEVPENTFIIGELPSKVANPTVKLIGTITAKTTTGLAKSIGLKNLIIDANGSANAVTLTDVDQAYIEKCKITNATGYGIYAKSTDLSNRAGGFWIHQTVITTTKGIYMEGLTQCWVYACWFELSTAIEWIHIVGGVKLRFELNEFGILDSDSGIASVIIEDSASDYILDVIFANNWHYPGSGKKIFSLNLGNHSSSARLWINDFGSTNGGWDYPNIPNSKIRILCYNTRRTENSGIATFSGDGSTTQFTIAHGLYAPAPANIKAYVTPLSADAASDFYITKDATNIYVNYISAPPAGTDNIVLAWRAEV